MILDFFLGAFFVLKQYSRIKIRMFIEIPLGDSFGNNINLEGYLTIPNYDNIIVH